MHAGCMISLVAAMETDHLAGDQRPRRQDRRLAVTAAGIEQQQDGAPPTSLPCLSAEALVALACVAVSLIVLPLVLPPLPPPPPLLLLVPVCLLLLLAALATFVPSDVRAMASSYL